MCDSEAEKILFILNKHERAYRRLIPVYIFLVIVLWILPILLIIYLYFCIVGFAPIFPDICYHLTHYKPAAADIPVASDNPAHYADAIRYNARTPLQGSLLPLTRLVWA